MKKSFFIIFTVIFSFLFLKSALAAQFFFYPDKGDLVTEQQFDVSLKIKTEGEETINGVQGKITFDKNLLEITSLSKEGSALNLSIQDAVFSNENGTIDLIGGITGGISGPSLQILKISFKAKAVGVAIINSIKEGSEITAHDGLGTNILTQVSDASFKISTPLPTPVVEPGVPKPAPTPTPAPIEQVPLPIQIERPVVIAKKLPSPPEVQIALYPDQESWYNKTSSFLVQWKLPEDITNIRTAINKNPAETLKSFKGEGLFESKIFPPLEDGINYLHIQFKNTEGWGTIMHYKLNTDTMPPLAFEIDIKEGSTTDNPQPTLTFTSGDQLSGIDHYQIKIPNFETITTSDTSYKLPVLAPGNYRILVRAYDRAGNISESAVLLNIQPIASPMILFFNKVIYIGIDSLAVKGRSLPNNKIIIAVKKLTGETFFSSVSQANDQGFWEAVLTPSFKNETYYLEVSGQDDRGALSLPVKSTFITVKSKPIFTIGFLEITAQIFYGVIIIILIIGFLSGFFFLRNKTKEKDKKIEENIIVAEKDLLALFQVVSQDLEKARKAFEDGKISKQEVVESELYLERIKEKLDKSKKYLVEEIEEIDDLN